MKIDLPVNRKYYHKAVLKILNFLTNMTDVELDIISTMLCNNIIILTKESRARMSLILRRDRYSFNNHVKRIKDKGVLIKNWHGQLEIAPGIVESTSTSIKDGEIVIKLHAN